MIWRLGVVQYPRSHSTLSPVMHVGAVAQAIVCACAAPRLC